MSDTPEYFPNRLERIEQIILGLAQRQAGTQEQLDNLTIRQANTQGQLDELSQEVRELSQEMRELTSNVDRVLGRSAILDDVLLELRDSHEQHQRNFEEHQRTTNAALQSLESILLQLIRNNP
jgi:predicted  nucleic acid-binding Zn-ribbon protein